MIKKLIILLISSLVWSVSFSQQYLFSTYSIDKGLSQSVVNCIFQDSKGYLWIGTQNGLNKFNGHSFEVYFFNPADTNSISNNWIFSIDEDREGNLWIGTKSGLNKFIRNEKKFKKITYQTGYQNDVTLYTYDAITSRTGNILINTPPVLTICNPGKNEFHHYISKLDFDGAVKDNRIPILEDSEGMIWIGSTRGLSLFDVNTKQFRYFLHDAKNRNSISDNNITALFEDTKGQIWIGTSNGLNVYDKDTKTMKRFIHERSNRFSLYTNFIRAIAEDKSGNMWIGTEGGGLSKLKFANSTHPVFEEFTSEDNGLSHNIVLDIQLDKSENLWIGTLQGISKTDLKERKFHLYREDDSPYSVDLLGNVVASLYKDENGRIWVGNWGQGLNIYNPKTGKVDHFSSSMPGKHYLPNDYIHVIFEDSERRIWIGTRDGIFIYDKVRNLFIRYCTFLKQEFLPDFTGVRIYMIIQDRNKNYWIGTQNGLYRFDLVKNRVEHFFKEAPEDHKVSDNLIYCLLEDREGLIWIATLNGLDVFNPVTRKMKHYKKQKDDPNSLADNFVITLCEDFKGDIWIGTSSYVSRFDKKLQSFQYFSQESGLPNNRIFEILEDNQKTLWFSTGGGLAKFNRVDSTFRTYSVEEGLQSLEFNLRAAYKAKDGEMFFGGMNGFNSFYPDSLKDNSYIPEIVITAFFKTNELGVKEYVDIENREEVLLDYNDHSFNIEFSALEYTNPEKNRYAYKMKGISDVWTEIGNRRFVTFFNLPPGEYIFTVKGSNNDRVWNETAKSLKIIISPPWWRSIPAYISYFLLVFLCIFLYVKWRERKLLRERNILERKVQERTLQIEKQKTEILSKNEELSKLNNELKELNATKDKFFSIIAHDLRNPFNTILGLSDILISNFQDFDTEKIIRSISAIKEASKHAYELLQNLLIWASSQTGVLEFKQVEFDLQTRILDNIELVEGQATKKNIEVVSTVETECRIIGDTNMIDTVLRNLLTNAIKFTPRNGKIVVSACRSVDQCEITIKDNGIGIAMENIDKLFKIDSKFTRKGTEKERSSGLGLILCKEFVEKHGGNIWVVSELGMGSEFKFSLPWQNQ